VRADVSGRGARRRRATSQEGDGPVTFDVGRSGCRPSRPSASARMWTVVVPRHLPSGPAPQTRSHRTSLALNGIQSIPRSRSQARTAAGGRRRPGPFPNLAMVTQSDPDGFMAVMMRHPRSSTKAFRVDLRRPVHPSESAIAVPSRTCVR
jgi:hypothetical protein